jgi:hypothetical protein
VQSFNCGNEVINEYLKKEAYMDTQATTFLIVSNSDRQVIAYYSLNCSGFVVGDEKKFTIYPAVEIKMFAIDERYQHMPYSTDDEDGNLSDMLFSDVIGYIYAFTDNMCGADKVILYSVPNAESFYIRNGFKRFERFMLQSTSLFLEGCIPMYLNL